MQNFAYQLAVGIFPQVASTGTKVSYLPAPFNVFEWDLSPSIIPVTYDFTNIQFGDATVETVENPTITQLSKAKSFDSGQVTPPTIQLATILPAEAATIVKTLDALGNTVNDPYKVLFAAGVYASTTSGVRTYNVIQMCAALLTADGSRGGNALQRFTGNLALQACHLPLIGTTECKATMSWTESTGAIDLALTP